MNATGIAHLNWRRLPAKEYRLWKELWFDIGRLQHRIFVGFGQRRLSSGSCGQTQQHGQSCKEPNGVVHCASRLEKRLDGTPGNAKLECNSPAGVFPGAAKSSVHWLGGPRG